LLRGADALVVPLFDDDELLRGADALLVPVFDEEFALGPPMRLVRPDRVCLVGAGIRVPGVEVPEPDGGPGSAREPDVLRVSAMHAGRTPPSTPFSLYLNALFFPRHAKGSVKTMLASLRFYSSNCTVLYVPVFCCGCFRNFCDAE